MSDQQKFAKDISKVIIGFMAKIDTVSGLNNYYLCNRAPIGKIQDISEEYYQDVIQAFKDKKGSILEQERE